MKKIIYFIILFVILPIFLSFTNDDYENYIKNNYKPLKISENNEIDNIVDFSLLDEDIAKSKIILSGEYHFIKYSYLLKFELLKYLNKKFNVRYLWVDESFSKCELINIYLTTGNVNIINDLFGDDDFYKEEKIFYKKLFNYNQSVSQKNKIKVIGFNLNDEYSTIYYLNYLLKNKKIPDKIITIYKELQNWYNYYINWEKIDNNFDTQNYYNLIFSIEKSINNNKTLYKNLLKDDFENFVFVIKNQIANYEILKKCNFSISGSKYNQLRDNIVYQNFLKYYNKINGEKIFGQFRYSHIIQTKIEFINFTQLLNKNNLFKNKILSIRYLYINCLEAYGYGSFLITDEFAGSELENNFVQTLLKYSKTNFTLFKLTGKNSPFSKKGNLVIYYPKYLQKDVSTTDFYQYIIVVKNSPKY